MLGAILALNPSRSVDAVNVENLYRMYDNIAPRSVDAVTVGYKNCYRMYTNIAQYIHIA